MDDNDDILEYLSKIGTFSDEEKESLNKKLASFTGYDNTVDVLLGLVNELKLSLDQYEEIEKMRVFEIQKSYLSDTIYFFWIKEYLNKNAKLASYHIRKKYLKSKDKEMIRHLKDVYDGIRSFAEAKNIEASKGNECTDYYYFVSFYGQVYKFGVYLFDGNVFCEIADFNELNNSINIINFNDVMEYFGNLSYDEKYQRDRS